MGEITKYQITGEHCIAEEPFKIGYPLSDLTTAEAIVEELNVRSVMEGYCYYLVIV